MKYLSIKDFEDLQHYKDWQPPWIKLYNRLLDDWKFLQLSEVAQRHLICLWLLASRHDNRIPNDLVYITRAIQAKSAVDLDEMIVAGFVIPTDAEPRHKRRKRNKLGRYNKSRHRIDKDYKKSTPETETETETEKNKGLPASPPRKNKPAPKYPGFPVSASNAIHAAWIRDVGSCEVSVIRKQLADFFPASGPLFELEEILGAVKAFSEIRKGQSQKERGFYTIYKFASDLVEYVRLGKQPYQDEFGAPTERMMLSVGT